MRAFYDGEPVGVKKKENEHFTQQDNPQWDWGLFDYQLMSVEPKTLKQIAEEARDD